MATISVAGEKEIWRALGNKSWEAYFGKKNRGGAKRPQGNPKRDWG